MDKIKRARCIKDLKDLAQTIFFESGQTYLIRDFRFDSFAGCDCYFMNNKFGNTQIIVEQFFDEYFVDINKERKEKLEKIMVVDEKS